MKARLVLAAAVMIMLAGPALAQSKEAIQKLNQGAAPAVAPQDLREALARYLDARGHHGGQGLEITRQFPD